MPPPGEFRLQDYTDKASCMFDGLREDVVLHCQTEITDQVIDCFGEDVNFQAMDSSAFDITIPTAVSNTFFAWLFQFYGEMRILASSHVWESYSVFLKRVLGFVPGIKGM